MDEISHSNRWEEPFSSGPLDDRAVPGFNLPASEKSLNGKPHTNNMPDDLITSENLSVELLKSILDAAYFDVSYDKDGDLQIQEDIKCYVVPARETKDRIGFQAVFAFKPESEHLDRLEFVNKVNQNYVLIRASARDGNTLHFGYDLMLAGGVTKKAFVLTLKRFCGIPRAAIREYGQEVVN